jgi:SagB-type dehydrogenase family enzyme
MADTPGGSGKLAGVIQLPKPSRESSTSVEAALRRRRSVREFRKEALTLTEVSQLLWATQGITDPEGKRTAPSAGALYPLEVLLVVGKPVGEGERPREPKHPEESGLAGTLALPVGLYRYQPQGHELLCVAEGDKRANLSAAALNQDWLADAPVNVVIAAVYERTARKYNQRAERYVHMEVGHAAQNLHLQAVALDLGTVVVGAFDDTEVKRVLALADNEQPVCLMPVGRPLLQSK